MSVGVSVRSHISKTTQRNHRGSVLLWRRRDTLYTSGFVDDVTFSHSGPMARLVNADSTTMVQSRTDVTKEH